MTEIAHPALAVIDSYRRATSLHERIDRLVFAFEILVRVDALAMAGAFLSFGSRDDKVRKLLLKNKLSLGDWHALLQAVATRLPRSYLGQIQSWVRKMEVRCQSLNWPECKGSPFQSLLFLRNWWEHDEGRHQADLMQRWRDIGDCCFARLLDQHPPLGVFHPCTAARLTYETVEGAVDCGPFLLNGNLVNQPETLLLYRRTEATALEYGTISGAVFRSSDAFSELTQRLGGAIPILETIESSASPHLLKSRMIECTQLAVDRFLQLKSFRPEIMVQSEQADIAMKAFLDGEQRLLLLDGPTGAGKTTWICSTAEQRILENRSVLLAPVDRLPNMTFPENLGALLKVTGSLALALERVSLLSRDERVLVLIDDLSESGKEEEAIPSLLLWAERIAPAANLKIVATLRTDRARDFITRNDKAFSADLVQRFHLPGMTTGELLELAERLPVPETENVALILDLRCDTAVRLGELADDSARRPGLAVPIIESVHESGIPEHFSAYSTYSRIFNQVVLESGIAVAPRAPSRGGLLRVIARTLFARGSGLISIDDLSNAGIRLVDNNTGERSADYRSLLSLEILVEVIDDFQVFVGLANPRFSEFLNSLDVPLDNRFVQELERLCQRAGSYPPTLNVAAFSVARAVRKIDAGLVWQAVKGLGELEWKLLANLAILDGHTLIAIVALAEDRDAPALCAMAEQFVDAGECRLASRVGELVVQNLAACQSSNDARFLCARAHFELDEYDQALIDLTAMSSPIPCRAHLLQGEIEASRGNWTDAKTAYECTCASTEGATLLTKAHATRGLGYTMAQLGEFHEAESLLQQALDMLQEVGDAKTLAETFSDLGEVQLSLGKPEVARCLFDKSLAVNKRLGNLGGIAIVLGLLGDLNLREGNIAEASSSLQQALQGAYRTGNRWRQAWTLDRLSAVRKAEGDLTEAERLADEAHLISEGINIRRQSWIGCSEVGKPPNTIKESGS